MKNNGFFAFIIGQCFLWLLLSCSIPAVADLSSAYTVGYGDVVTIKVFGEEELTVVTQLNDLSVISFPFLGEVEVFGLTVTEVQDKITTGL